MIFPRNGQIDPLVCHQRLYCCLQVDYYGENTRLFASLIAGSPDRPGAAADHLADKRLAQIRSLSIVGSQPLIGQHRDKTRIKSLSFVQSASTFSLHSGLMALLVGYHRINHCLLFVVLEHSLLVCQHCLQRAACIFNY